MSPSQKAPQAHPKANMLTFPMSADAVFNNLVDAVSIVHNPVAFCYEGTQRAMVWTRTAAQVVEMCGTADPERLRLAVYVSLEELLEHWAGCRDCQRL